MMLMTSRFNALRSLLLPCAAMLLGSLCACEEHVVGTHFAGMGTRADTKEQAGKPFDFFGLLGSTDGNEWTVALYRVEGDHHAGLAREEARNLQSASGMQQVWINEMEDHSLICYGRYTSRGSQAARSDLTSWQTLAQSGRIKPPLLQMTPIVEREKIESPFDLRQLRGRGIYTLQIGFYENELNRQYARQQAEARVAELRATKVDAYFYHGPNRSLVTLGVFGDDAVRTGIQNQTAYMVYAPRVMSLQQRFPYNTINGEPLQDTRGGKPATRTDGSPIYQPSFLVKIPAGSGRQGPGNIRYGGAVVGERP